MKSLYFTEKSRLFMTAGFLALLSMSANAQTREDAKALAAKTNFSILSKAQARLSKTVVSDAKLKAFAKSSNVPYSFQTEDGRMAQLAAIESNGTPMYMVTHNAKAAITSGVNKIRKGGESNYNLTGKNVKILEWDGGHVRADHIELDGKIILGPDVANPPVWGDHGTHVAGTMVATGVNKLAMGMAPEATIKSWNFEKNYFEINEAMKTQDGIISNHSYGFSAGWLRQESGSGYKWLGDDNVSKTEDYKFGYYSEFDAALDEILKGAPWHTYIGSAGNQRGEGPKGQAQQVNGGALGYDSMGYGSLSKNAIFVGAVEPVLDYKGPESVKLTSFSSCGPADDGRIFPLVVNDGYLLTSSTAKDKGSYAAYSGTSMSSPATAGSVALMQEFAKNKTGKYLSSPLVKALLANTAKEAGNPGPDYYYGFGLVDAATAVETLDYNGKSTRYKEGVLGNGEVVTINFPVQAGKPVKATLAWVDRPFDLPRQDWISTNPDKPQDNKNPSYLNNRRKMLVDDLDLRITINGKEYRPYVLDPDHPANNATTGDNVVDNIEQIYIDAPESGNAVLTIKHKNNLEPAGVDYAFVVNGVSVANDLEATNLQASVPQDNFSVATPVKVNVKNLGTKDITGDINVKFTVKNDIGEVIEEKTEKLSLGLVAGASREVSTTLSLTEVFKNYNVSAQVVYDADEAQNNNTARATLIPTVADLTQGGARMLENFNIDDLKKHEWQIVNKFEKKSNPWAFSTRIVTYDNSQYVINGNSDKPVDDWMLTNPVKLTAGDTYRVSFYTYKYSMDPTNIETLNVYVGDNKSVEAMTNKVGTFTHNQADPSEVFKKVTFEFKAQKDGVQYLGIQHQSNKSWGMALDDFKIENIKDGKPSPDFNFTSADSRTWNTIYTDITMVNETVSTPPVTAYKWTFVPNNVKFLDGTSETSENPKFRFTKLGRYAVKLEATNPNGKADIIKTDYIFVGKPTLNLDFQNDREKIYVNENVVFTNKSLGLPKVQSYKWEITPNENAALEYLDQTSQSTKDINVKFKKADIYTVKLIATNAQGKDSVVKENIVNVRSNDNPPINLTAKNEPAKSATLNWEKPETLYYDSYLNEPFDLHAPWPRNDWYAIDANKDGLTWSPLQAPDGNFVAATFSWYYGKERQEDDYLVSPVIKDLPKGYTELTLNSPATSKNPKYAEELTVYYVPVSDDTKIDETFIKNNAKVIFKEVPYNYTNNLRGFQKLDLTPYIADGKAFRLVFYANTFNRSTTTLDNVRISKPGFITPKSPSINPINSWGEEDGQDFRDRMQYFNKMLSPSGQVYLSENAATTDDTTTATPTWSKLEIGPNNNITHYEIVRDGQVLGATDGTNTVYIDNTITKNGQYCYNVVAVYDGLNRSQLSNQACIIVNSSDLATNEVGVNSVATTMAFPNPVVDFVKVKFAKAISGKTDAEVYGFDGRKLISKTVDAAEISNTGIDLTQLKSGVYVLVIKNDGKAYSVKIIKK